MTQGPQHVSAVAVATGGWFSEATAWSDPLRVERLPRHSAQHSGQARLPPKQAVTDSRCSPCSR